MKDITEIKYKIPDEDKDTIFEKTNKKKWIYANYFLIFLIFISIIIAFLSTMWDIYNKYFNILFISDFAISFIFLIEYIYRFKNSDQKSKFPFKILNILDLFSFMPFFILLIIKGPAVYWLFALFRIFRIFRILELFEKIPISIKILKWIIKHKTELITWIFIIFLILLIFTSLVYISETIWWNKWDFSSLTKTLWWAIYAITTSWDAWLIPQTIIWRVLAWILMVIWPIIISIISSIIILIFLDATSIIDINKNKSKCKHCKTRNSNDSKYCKECGKKLK